MAGPDIDRIVAPNPGPMTLEGTNSYLVGREPAILIDPGPADENHIAALRAAATERGGIEEVLLTHRHGDHAEGVGLLGIHPAGLGDGDEVAGIKALATPGHALDHLCFLLPKGHPAAGDSAPVLFSGDLILGEGSSIVPPAQQGGSLTDYMESLRRVRDLEPALIYPGHGPPITDPPAKIDSYIEHRESRERRLVEALERGERSRMALLRAVWDDVPEELLPAAAYAMQAHMDKLAEEGLLPRGISE